MAQSYIEVVKNTAFSIEQNNYVTRKTDEKIEEWCDRIIRTLVPRNTTTLFVNSFYPVNPFINCYYLTKSFSMKTAKNISLITGLNIINFCSFKSIKKPKPNLIDCLFVIGSKTGFLSEDAIELAKNLNTKIQKDKKIIFCGNEDLLNFFNFDKVPNKIDYPSSYLKKGNLVDLAINFANIFFCLYEKNFKNFILNNELLQNVVVKINSTEDLIKKNIQNYELDVVIDETICKYYITERKKHRLIGVIPFVKIENNDLFIFDWFGKIENKSKVLEIIAPNDVEDIFLKIIEKKVNKETFIWLNIFCFLHTIKGKSLNINSIKVNNVEYRNYKIFQKLLSFVSDLS